MCLVEELGPAVEGRLASQLEQVREVERVVAHAHHVLEHEPDVAAQRIEGDRRENIAERSRPVTRGLGRRRCDLWRRRNCKTSMVIHCGFRCLHVDTPTS